MAILTQEPPVPTPSDMPDFAPSPMLFIVVAIVVAEIIAWKYRAYIEYLAILFSTIGGFIIGIMLTPPYANIGLGIMTSMAALFLSTAIIIIIRLIQRAKQATTTI